MAAKRARVAGSITRKIPVEIIQPRFEVFQSLADLDLEKLARTRRSTLEIGTLSSGACQQLVRAVVVRGMVTAIEIEPCRKEGNAKAPADLVEAVRDAARIARRVQRPQRWKPIPVARLAQSARSMLIDSITCYRFCIWGHCIICCSTVAGQIVCTFGDVIIHGPIVIVFG